MNSNVEKTKMGFVLKGIDISKPTRDDIFKIKESVLKYGCVCIKGNEKEPQDIHNFMSNFGTPIELPKQIAHDNQVEGCETITRISNVTKEGILKEKFTPSE